MAGFEPGVVLTAITVISGAVGTIWTLAGKSKDNSFTRLEGERNRLDARVGELEKGREEDRARLDKVEDELEELKRAHVTLLDFLRDICSGRFDGDWIKGRASDLLERFGGGNR